MSDASRRSRLEVEDIGDVTVIKFTDRKILDEQNIQIIGEQLYGIVDDLNRTKMVLNFENVDYLSSSVLGKLVGLNRRIQEKQGRLALCCIDPKIDEIFDLTGLRRIFNIYEEEQEALQSF